MKETLKNRKLWRVILCAILLVTAVMLVVLKSQSKNDVISKATITDLSSTDSTLDTMPDAYTRDFRQNARTRELSNIDFPERQMDPPEDVVHSTEYVVENWSPEPSIWELCSSWTDKLTANLPQIAQLWIIAIVYIVLVVLLLRILSWGCMWIIDIFNRGQRENLEKEKNRYNELLALLEDNYAKSKETNRELNELLEKANYEFNGSAGNSIISAKADGSVKWDAEEQQ